MSELKPYTHVSEELDSETGKYALYAYDVDGNRTKIDDTELVYLKSEADKFIADLEESHKKEVGQLLMEIDELKKACNDKDDWCRHTLKENRHHKHKRCLAMAEKCFESREYWRYRYDDWSDKGYDRPYKWRKVEFLGSWGRRWLKIAEKFKEAKCR